jgi:signal transduction histidine kinase
MLIYISIAVFILLVLLLYITLRFLKIRSKTNKKLTKLNKEISEKQEEIISQSEELQAANEQIKQFNLKLERKVIERTNELVQAQKDLDLFFYKASHDFRGPLTTFMGISQVAKMSISNTEALELFKRVEKTAKKLDKMVRKLQFISLLNAQDINTLSKQDIQTEEVFSKIKQDVQSTSRGSNIEINCKTNTHKISFYHEHLEIMLEVLVENAITFNNSSVPVIDLEISISEKSLVIKVKDNGNGIHQEEYSQIFEMFHRNSAESKGNGLGLFLLKRLVAYLNGDIKLSSEIGKGTEFTLIFPYD